MDKLDQIFALIGGTLEPGVAEKLRADLKNPSSETSRLVETIRQVARAEIDINRIPGLEELAKVEASIEAQLERKRRERPV